MVRDVLHRRGRKCRFQRREQCNCTADWRGYQYNRANCVFRSLANGCRSKSLMHLGLNRPQYFATTFATTQMVSDAVKCGFPKLRQGMKKALKVLQCNAFRTFQPGTPEGTRTPNIQNRKQYHAVNEIRCGASDCGYPVSDLQPPLQP